SIHPLRFCGALQRFWWTRGHLAEGWEWCVRALGKAGGQERTQARSKALNGAGVLARMLGDYVSARACLEESLAILREIGGRSGTAYLLNNLGMVDTAQGEYAAARADLAESLDISREMGNKISIAASLNGLGNLVFYQG